MKAKTTLILSILFLNVIMAQEHKIEQDSTQNKIDKYLEKAEHIVDDNGDDIAKFIGKVKGHKIFKRINKQVFTVIDTEINLIKDAGLQKDAELKEAYTDLKEEHNKTINEMMAKISNASGLDVIFAISLKKEYLGNKKNILLKLQKFKDLSYTKRTNLKHAGILDIILVVFKIKALVEKFNVQIENVAKPIIIEKLNDMKINDWETALTKGTSGK